MKSRRHLITAVILFIFLFAPAAYSEILVLSNGKELQVEKTWSEGDQIYFIFHGMQAGIPQSKVKRIKAISKDQNKASIRQNNQKTGLKKNNNNSAKDVLAVPKMQTAPISPTSQPTAMATEQSCDLLIDGFCDLQWGVDVSSVDGLEKKKSVSGFDDVIEYIRPRKNLKIGDATPISIVYSFWRNRLYTVTIWTLEHSNYTALRDRVFEKFGKGRQVDPSDETYLWSNTYTDMMLEYEKKGQLGMLWLRSSELDRKYKLSVLNRHTSYLRWMKSRK